MTTNKEHLIPVDNIRFLSMFAIIFVHSFIYFWSPNKEMHSSDYMRIILIDFFKYGTLCFFMISGYLLGSKLEEYGRFEFFRRRMKIVAKPWIFWSTLLGLALITAAHLNARSWHLSEIAKLVYLQSEYWFVLNYFIALAIMLFARAVPSRINGILFLTASIFYAANIYIKIIPTIHTTATFGYVFYLWYGSEVRRGKNHWINGITNLKIGILVSIATIAYCLSILESIYIKTQLGTNGTDQIYFNDPVNTLRITNQLFGIIMFSLFFKFKKNIFPKWMSPRDETFGLYLVHWPILMATASISSRLLANYLDIDRVTLMTNMHLYLDAGSMVAMSAGMFVFLYFGSLSFVKLMRHTRFSWAVGKI